MIEDLIPFFLMLFGMVAVGVTLVIVQIKNSMDLPKEFRTPRYREAEQTKDYESSAGQGAGFTG